MSPVLFGNLAIFQKSAIHLALRRDTQLDHIFTMLEKFVDNVLTVAGNPEKARLATFPEMIPTASEAGQP